VISKTIKALRLGLGTSILEILEINGILL